RLCAPARHVRAEAHHLHRVETKAEVIVLYQHVKALIGDTKSPDVASVQTPTEGLNRYPIAVQPVANSDRANHAVRSRPRARQTPVPVPCSVLLLLGAQ